MSWNGSDGSQKKEALKEPKKPSFRRKGLYLISSAVLCLLVFSFYLYEVDEPSTNVQERVPERSRTVKEKDKKAIKKVK